MGDDDRSKTIRSFEAAVNMSADDLAAWLETDESRSVGYVRDGEDEAVGHRSGRRIVELLGRADADLSADDLSHMRKVVGYVHRHLAQRPEGDVRDARWRYSLMNWGHDPLAE